MYVRSRAFNVSEARISNDLPEKVVSASTFSSFRRRLKPFLFQQSYPDIVIWYYSGPCGDVYHLGHSKNHWTELNYHFRDITSYLSTIAIFLFHVYLAPQLDVKRMEFHRQVSDRRTDIGPYAACGKNEDNSEQRMQCFTKKVYNKFVVNNSIWGRYMHIFS